jgi:gliding motility-associated-like protein
VPDPIEDASSVVDDDETKVSLSWLQGTAFTPEEYTILRSPDGTSFLKLVTVTTTIYDDNDYRGKFCYRVNYEDVCDRFSPDGISFCPLHLAGNRDPANVISLQWNDYTGWQNGVSYYQVAKFDQAGTLLKTFSISNQTNFIDNETDTVNQVVSYQVTAFANDTSPIPSVSNKIDFTKSVNLYCPNAFTPNGDDLNDTFNVMGQFIADLQVIIFDRWGNIIFASNAGESWDGTYNGRLMPEATYVWKADGKDLTGRSFTSTGSIVLLHKK